MKEKKEMDTIEQILRFSFAAPRCTLLRSTKNTSHFTEETIIAVCSLLFAKFFHDIFLARAQLAGT
jgi:hypothetical protein